MYQVIQWIIAPIGISILITRSLLKLLNTDLPDCTERLSNHLRLRCQQGDQTRCGIYYFYITQKPQPTMIRGLISVRMAVC